MLDLAFILFSFDSLFRLSFYLYFCKLIYIKYTKTYKKNIDKNDSCHELNFLLYRLYKTNISNVILHNLLGHQVIVSYLYFLLDVDRKGNCLISAGTRFHNWGTRQNIVSRSILTELFLSLSIFWKYLKLKLFFRTWNMSSIKGGDRSFLNLYISFIRIFIGQCVFGNRDHKLWSSSRIYIRISIVFTIYR